MKKVEESNKKIQGTYKRVNESNEKIKRSATKQRKSIRKKKTKEILKCEKLVRE